MAVDVSDSIVESQSTRVTELLAALDPESTEVSLIVFGRSQGLERPMSPLSANSKTQYMPESSQLSAVVDRNGTDVSGLLQFARAAFGTGAGPRAVLLISDFRDTINSPKDVLAAASSLGASGIHLLASPASLVASSDVQLVEFRAPEIAESTRAIPLDITLASQNESFVKVRVTRNSAGRAPVFIESKNVKLEGSKIQQVEIRRTVRIIDTPQPPGVTIYTASLSGPEGPLPGDVLVNNSLSAAVRVVGPSRWAFLTRANSTLAKLAEDSGNPLGASVQIFNPGRFPTDAARYESFAGILLDGLSATELKEGSAELRALETAVHAGKALVALGGAAAFGAGGHARGGSFEKLLPAELTPQDDRVRSVVFLLDVSRSMDDGFTPRGGSLSRKLDFAAGQLAAVQQLRPQDRLGLIEFSGVARIAAPLSAEPTRSAFLDAARSLSIQNNTDILSALDLARKTLALDSADEQLVILISDGIQTIARPREEILRAAEALCPIKADGSRRRTTLWTFGIGVEKEDANPTGEALLKDLAQTGGGKYSPDFENLKDGLSRAFEEGEKDYFIRRSEFIPRPAPSGTGSIFDSQSAWPSLQFLNRIKAKPGADVILWSGESKNAATGKRPDPLLILSGPGDDGLAKRAALALTLDGPDGATLLASDSTGRRLLSNVMSWAEARSDSMPKGMTLSVEHAAGDKLEVELRAIIPASGSPISEFNAVAMLTELLPAASSSVVKAPLKLKAPGVYRAIISAPPASVCRLVIRENDRTLAERFVSTPCPVEARRFGVDRAAMSEMVAKAGNEARVIDAPRDLAAWAAAQKNTDGSHDLRGWMLGAGIIFLLASWGWRTRSGV